MIIILAGVAWKMGYLKMSGPTGMATTTPSIIATTTETVPSSGLPTADTDTSDAAMVQDSAAIDAQIQGMNSDQASLDQSMSDKPVTQSY
ncbi:MAG: hypothetical protein JWO43_212 [Candidatus Adlerbacteria bacterium]|nr:hypothetical protein [Candidatus Adlerbacteria bacterium]